MHWLDRTLALLRRLRPIAGAAPPSRARRLAAEDASRTGAAFALGSKPVLHFRQPRAIDDAIARSAIARTTRALHATVDYRLSTPHADAARARFTLERATQPIDWQPDSSSPANTTPRARHTAPELIVHADIALLAKPDWFADWSRGHAPHIRRSADATIEALPPAPHHALPHHADPHLLPPPDGQTFHRLAEPDLDPQPPSLLQRFAWLGGSGQWGVPGWSLNDTAAQTIVDHLARRPAARALELGTARGRLAAMLAGAGCKLVTVDHQDRGAARNLAGLDVEVIRADAASFLTADRRRFDLIVVDLHGNDPETWRRLRKPLLQRLAPHATLILNNARLHEMPDWREESGVAWFLESLPADWRLTLHPDPLPGLAIVTLP